MSKLFEVERFNPENFFLKFWGLISLLVSIFFTVFKPIEISFKLSLFEEYDMFFSKFLRIFPIIFYLMDIIINLNTAFYKQGDYIVNRKKIWYEYCRINLFIDLITITPLIIHFIAYPYYNLLNFLFIFRFFRIKNNLRKIIENLNINEKVQGYLELVRMALLMLILINLCSCIWYSIALFEIERGSTLTWIHNHDLIDEGKLLKYISAFHLSVLTMCTAGHFSVNSINEKIVSIIVTFILTGVFAVGLNEIGFILNYMHKK